MQADEDIGKIALPVPLLVCKLLLHPNSSELELI